MSLTEWAKKEIEIACKNERGNAPDDEWDYGCACYESAFKAFNTLMEDGHSGMSIGITKNILVRLIEGKPLTPIEDTPAIWNLCTRGAKEEKATYQCSRMSALFKYVYNDGTVKYSDIDRCCGIDVDSPNCAWYSGYISRLIDEMWPITMPYIPPTKPIKVYFEECLTDAKNGDYDTKAVLYCIKDDERIEIDRYYKEVNGEMVEIDKAEYLERKAMSDKRIVESKGANE